MKFGPGNHRFDVPGLLPLNDERVAVSGVPLGSDSIAHRRDDAITNEHRTLVLIFSVGAYLGRLSITCCTISRLACDQSMHASCSKNGIGHCLISVPSVILVAIIILLANKYEVTTCNE